KFNAWDDRYDAMILADSSSYSIPFKSVTIGVLDSLKMSWKSLSEEQRSRVQWRVNGSIYQVVGLDTTKDITFIPLPVLEQSYSLEVHLNGVCIGKVYVSVYHRLEHEVVIVPLVKLKLQKDSVQAFLNKVYGQAQLNLSVTLKPRFIYEKFRTKLLDNPSDEHDRYTDQMTMIRDAYFEANPDANRNSYYIFITAGFVNDELQGYMVRNKAVGFVRKGELKELRLNIAKQLGFGIGVLDDTWLNIGPSKGTTDNLMDSRGGIVLTHYQWVSIQQRASTISYYDDYEDVNTNSGIIGFYLWEENEKGELILSGGSFHKGIVRPFKRNQFSYHLDITSIFFKPIFSLGAYRINALHFLALLVLLILGFFLGRKFIRWTRTKKLSSWVLRSFMRLMIIIIFFFLSYESFQLVNSGYSIFQVQAGELKEFNGFSIKQVRSELKKNRENPKLEEPHLGSQILVKKKDKWYLKKRRRVLYFNSVSENGSSTYRHVADSDSLKLSKMDYAELAESHYMVVNYFDSLGSLTDQKVFNHFGTDITKKLKLKDPSKRILVFVNGYRPTSLGNSFEENFNDVTKFGLEFPNSNNLIYDFDRYEYWRPWKEFDLLFKDRINPGETYYADGHFSVSTSNHRSLVNFTTLAGIYPKRCQDPNKHVCKTSSSGGIFHGEEKTVNLFELEPNIDGFNERKRNGKIAGRNLYQMFNELPNKSRNDTLFIVAHSMGFAYSLGVVEELRGKINFGGFYIIAPENASVGLVKMSEWMEVWQYGSNFDQYKYKAPCLLDGIAPQTKVGGLSNKCRVYIPESYFEKRGFFSTHFIGNYRWIFDLKPKTQGYIKQR
ncbi:MAG: hypothetical protein ACI837_001417, partial [Crocinitomicaceae bacterium]